MYQRKSKLNKAKVTKKCNHYDDKLSQELAEILEIITHSGEKVLSDSEYKKVKDICKCSDKYIKEVYDLLLGYLKKNHAEVRWSAFQICNKIFRGFHYFRELVVFDLEQLVKLTTGEGLPPPQKVAKELRRFALRCIHEWNLAFGKIHKKLAIGYRYLQNVKKINFSDYLENSTAQRCNLENNQSAIAVNEARTNKILAEIKEKKTDIKAAVISLSNSINLLLPHPDEFFISLDEDEVEERKEAECVSARVTFGDPESDSDEAPGDTGLREVGMVNVQQSLQLHITPSSEAYIHETPENSAVISNAREYAKVIQNKYFPTVKAWLAVLSKSEAAKEELRDLVELKGEIDDVLFKYGRMVFISADDVSSDSELEEVPEPPQTQTVDVPSTSYSTEWNIVSQEDNANEVDPATRPVQKTANKEPQPSTSVMCDRKHKLLAVAPKLPFDVDLLHWEDDKLPVPTLIPSSTDGHRFWVGAEASIDELPVPEGSASLRTRVIEFTGNFTPVAHSCRVRLPSGKLCPRHDRVKCPFHGEIVPRDESGNCINIKDAIRLQELREKQQQEKPDWQNPKLLAEIKKATGIDLKMPEKGRRKKRKGESGLTDLKEIENTPKKRLERKIFKKSAMKKVASTLDKIDQRKFKDKYGDQFNYFYNT